MLITSTSAQRSSNFSPATWALRAAGRKLHTLRQFPARAGGWPLLQSSAGKTRVDEPSALAARRCRHPHCNLSRIHSSSSPITMKNPPIHITPHHISLTPFLRDYIRRKISAVSRFAGDVVAADVVVRGKSGAAHRYSISARLALPGQDIQGHATDSNLYTAIGQLVTRLARRSRKRKTRFEKNIRRARRPQVIRGSTPQVGVPAQIAFAG